MKIKVLFQVCLFGCMGSLSAQTPQLFNNINPGGGNASPHWLRASSTDIIYFAANDGTNGFELWRTDGTLAGTYLLKDIVPGSGDSYPMGFTEMSGDIYFAAWTPAEGTELWKTDGTSAGTVMVKDIQPGSISSIESMDWNYYTPWSPITVMNNHIYFIATNGSNGYEIWKSDGTNSGTVMLKDINAGSGSGMYVDGSGMGTSEIFVHNGTIYFTANNGSDGFELWKSDGTTIGTVMIEDMWTGTNGSFPLAFCAHNNIVYFRAYTPAYGAELWSTNGTAAGTDLLLDINPGASDAYPYDLVELGSYFYFHAEDATNGRELWRSDGTASGTVLLKDIYPGSTSAQIQNLRKVGNLLFLLASSPVVGYEPWVSDGTTAGTNLLKDINPGALDSYAALFTAVGSEFYFAAYDAGNGQELWHTDGTTAGTTLAADIYPGTIGSGPDNFTELNGMLLFRADDGTNGAELWYLSVCGAGNLDIGNDTTICIDEDITLEAGAGYTSYLWSNATTGQNLFIDGNTAGLGSHDYWVTVTDVNGCEYSDTVEVYISPCNSVAEELTGVWVDVYPNPVSGDYCNISIKSDVYDKKYVIEVFNPLGQIIYTEAVTLSSGVTLKQINNSGWSAGMYSVRIIGEKGQLCRKIVIER